MVVQDEIRVGNPELFIVEVYDGYMGTLLLSTLLCLHSNFPLIKSFKKFF